MSATAEMSVTKRTIPPPRESKGVDLYEAETARAKYRAERMVSGLMVSVRWKVNDREETATFFAENAPYALLHDDAVAELRAFIAACGNE